MGLRVESYNQIRPRSVFFKKTRIRQDKKIETQTLKNGFGSMDPDRVQDPLPSLLPLQSENDTRSY